MSIKFVSWKLQYAVQVCYFKINLQFQYKASKKIIQQHYKLTSMSNDNYKLTYESNKLIKAQDKYMTVTVSSQGVPVSYMDYDRSS